MGRNQSPAQVQAFSTFFLERKETLLENRLVRFILKRHDYFLVPVFLALALGLWYLVINSSELPPYILPTPLAVWKKFLKTIQEGILWEHTLFTLKEASLGFLGAVVFASIMGYVLAKSRILEKLLSPYLVAAQTVPLIAIAPLLVVWLGFGIASKVFIVLVIVFFPMLINVIIGIKLVADDQRELMRSYSASHWQVFYMLELPSALPLLLSGLKIGITMAITGALVGEYVGAYKGLGFMILHSKQKFDTAEVFVTIFTLVLINVFLYGAVSVSEGFLLAGRKREESL
jgi:NitT/TauT family transport system permease protein